MRINLAPAVAALLFATTHGLAQQPSYAQLRTDCADDSDIARQIAGCNAVIINPSESIGIRAIAASNRGHARERDGDIAGAMADYDWAITVDPSYVNAIYNRANLFARAGLLDRALADFDRAIAADGLPAGHFERGLLHMKRRDWARAIADFDVSLRAKPRDAEGLSARGRAHAERGDHLSAQADFEAALAVEPKRAEALEGRANARAALALARPAAPAPPPPPAPAAAQSGALRAAGLAEAYLRVYNGDLPIVVTHVSPTIVRSAPANSSTGMQEVEAASCGRIIHRQFSPGPAPQLREERTVSLDRQRSLLGRDGPNIRVGAEPYGELVRMDQGRPVAREPIQGRAAVLAPGHTLYAIYNVWIGVIERFCPGPPPDVRASASPSVAAPVSPSQRGCDQAGSRLNLERGRASGVLGATGVDSAGPYLVADSAWWSGIPQSQRDELAQVVHCAEGRWGAPLHLRIIDQARRAEIAAFEGGAYRHGQKAEAPAAAPTVSPVPADPANAGDPPPPASIAEGALVAFGLWGYIEPEEHAKLQRSGPDRVRLDKEEMILTGKPGYTEAEARSCASAVVSDYGTEGQERKLLARHIVDFERLRGLVRREGADFAVSDGTYGERILVYQGKEISVALTLTARRIVPSDNDHSQMESMVRVIELFCAGSAGAAQQTASAPQATQTPAEQKPPSIQTATGLMRDEPFSLSYPSDFEQFDSTGTAIALRHRRHEFQVFLTIERASGALSASEAEARFDAESVTTAQRRIHSDFALDGPRGVIQLPAGPAFTYRGAFTTTTPARLRMRYVQAELYNEGRRYTLSFYVDDSIFEGSRTLIGFMLANFSPNASRRCCADAVSLP